MQDINSYKSLRNTVDIVVLAADDLDTEGFEADKHVPSKGLQVMLVKRTEEPFKDMWVLPGGFVDYDKPLDQCVKDKLALKTGLNDVYFEQLYTYGNNIHRDPRDRVITVAYTALIDKKSVIAEHTDEETAWFWINPSRVNGEIVGIELVPVDKEDKHTSIDVKAGVKLGFDHYDILLDALNRIANKALYTEIVYQLMPKLFTIKELENTFEAVIGRKIAGFRRLISNRVVETQYMSTDIKSKPCSYRPARVYTYI